jgi:cobalt/nickel transport system ATP-binding protein
MRPEILLLDEPTSGLDPAARKRVSEILCSTEKPAIIATHDLDMALDVCGRVVVLNRGTVTVSGDAQVILRDGELLRQNGLDLPLRFTR